MIYTKILIGAGLLFAVIGIMERVWFEDVIASLFCFSLSYISLLHALLNYRLRGR